MSFKNVLKRGADSFFMKLLEAKISKRKSKVILTVVFHVEKLHSDKLFLELKSFCREFQSLTNCHAVLTCMTPHSPILEKQLKEENFSPELYWERIRELGQIGLVGLHGHYVRRIKENGQPVPMHYSFYDINHISDQIDLETQALLLEGLVKEDELVYSGGWWFTCETLRAVLVDKGFNWDYSVSSSPVNRSPGSDALDLLYSDALRVGEGATKRLQGSVAVSSISKKDRPFHAFYKIWKNSRQIEGLVSEASLYSHDYDLHRPSAIAFVNRALDIGVKFDQPRFGEPAEGIGIG